MSAPHIPTQHTVVWACPKCWRGETIAVVREKQRADEASVCPAYSIECPHCPGVKRISLQNRWPLTTPEWAQPQKETPT